MGEVAMLEALSTSLLKKDAAIIQLQGWLESGELPAHLHATCEAHIAELTSRPNPEPPKAVYSGLGRMAGSQLPTCAKKHAKTSVLTNALIRGPAFDLENRKLHVSLSDALAWARVNAFSPLNTGCKIQPV